MFCCNVTMYMYIVCKYETLIHKYIHKLFIFRYSKILRKTFLIIDHVFNFFFSGNQSVFTLVSLTVYDGII
jgi:hypothetical protein